MLQHDGKHIISNTPPPLDVSNHALFLDLDGTLIDFASHPDEVVASAELRRLLQRLSDAMDGAIAIVTGRTVASADAVLGCTLVHVAGIHGFEHRALGVVERPPWDLSSVAAALADARAMVANGALNVDIEDKGAAFAFHYRRSPELADHIQQMAAELAQRHGLNLLQGKMVAELRLGGRTKADAVGEFMRAPPFAGRSPIAVGDDVTDEDAFIEVNALGGEAILVGRPRSTAARWRLRDTAAVQAWLSAGVTA